MRNGVKFGQRFQAIFMFLVGCITSPCCTPLIVPLGLSLLVGTPAAVWLGHNLGWVYGTLTLVSIASFVIAFRAYQASRENKPADPVSLISQGIIKDHHPDG